MSVINLRISNKEKKNRIKNYAQSKYSLNLSDYIRMLIKEDMIAILKSPEQLKEEQEIIKQLRFENDKLTREIGILKEHIMILIELSTNKILQKIDGLTISSDQIEKIEDQILTLLNETIQGKRIKLSLAEISARIRVKEEQVIQILDRLIESERVKFFKNMKYGRID
ncbi:MAG: hypothetical protein EAX89_17645 [Candidatus Lokiarchaeota archaeon]|nr:hypothetical protein [Candidatus Lokiarchaeota archaeon]